MVDQKRYLELGGFDTMYHPLYYEEIDLSYRALKRGWKVAYEPTSIAYHKVQSTITRQEKSRRIGLISARNNYLFVWKNILDGKMTREFMVFIPLFLLRDLFRLKSRFWIAFYMALNRLPAALEGSRKRVLRGDGDSTASVGARRAHRSRTDRRLVRRPARHSSALGPSRSTASGSPVRSLCYRACAGSARSSDRRHRNAVCPWHHASRGRERDLVPLLRTLRLRFRTPRG